MKKSDLVYAAAAARKAFAVGPSRDGKLIQKFRRGYAPINVMPHYHTDTRAEVGEGGDLHLRKIQIPTYWGSCPCIIPSITLTHPELQTTEIVGNCT